MNTVKNNSLTEEEVEYYSRQIVLNDIGYAGQLKLKKARASIIGLGGLGTPMSVQLTAMGVGHLRLVDRDVVERSNLQRQHLYDVEHLGFPKVEVAAEKLSKLNPSVEFEPLTASINAENVEEIISGSDVVLDGLDRMSPRYALNRACVKLGIPYIFGAAIMNLGNVSTIVTKITPCLECFYGNLPDERTQTCAVLGIHPSVLGITASIEVSEAIRILLGKEPRLLSKLLYIDLGNMSFDKIEVARRPNCPVCGENSSEKPTVLKRRLVEEICGRKQKRTFTVTPSRSLELDIVRGSNKIEKKGLKIRTRTRLGVTFNYNDEVEVSILSSGASTLVGASGEDEALDIAQRSLSEFFGVSVDLIR